MIHEPMTMATDYLLGVVVIIFAASLRRRHAPPANFWAIAFLATAIAAFTGGSYHGFGGMLTEPILHILWKATMIAIGAASLSFGLGLIRARFRKRPERILSILFWTKFVLYLAWVSTHDSFLWVVLDYGITLVFILAVEIFFVRRSPASRWILGSITVAFLAAAIQQSGFLLHRHFNHNDLYHLVQIVALWLLYRGGAKLAEEFER